MTAHDDQAAADAQAAPPAGGDVPDLARFLCETEGLLLQCAAQLRRDREVLERAREHVMESESENDHLRAELLAARAWSARWKATAKRYRRMLALHRDRAAAGGGQGEAGEE